MTTLIKLRACQRCGGRPYQDEDEIKCIACGRTMEYLPEPVYVPHPPEIEEDELGPVQQECLDRLQDHEGWVNTPSIELVSRKSAIRALQALQKRGLVEGRMYMRAGRKYHQWRAL